MCTDGEDDASRRGIHSPLPLARAPVWAFTRFVITAFLALATTALNGSLGRCSRAESWGLIATDGGRRSADGIYDSREPSRAGKRWMV